MSSTKSKQVVIVGAGLFGSIAAELCSSNGMQVVAIDSNEPYAGSKAAACLMKPSWMSSLGKSRVDAGLEVLDTLYGLKGVDFSVNGVASHTVWHVPPGRILRGKRRWSLVRDVVVKVEDGKVVTRNSGEFKGVVLVAAGVWSEQLVSMPSQRQLMGAAVMYEGSISPIIKVWAPYRQAVAFNIRPNRIWMGDGTAIIKKNFDEQQRVKDSVNRAKKFFNLEVPRQIIVGARPYMKGCPGFYKKLGDNLYVSTGGAKNGTVLAAYQAKLFLEDVT